MPDRPVECNQCKKAIKVLYKEIVDDSVICTEMCADCPAMQSKLQGSLQADDSPAKENGMCCGVCKTSLRSLQMSQPLGCSDCYAIFGDYLTSELIAVDAVPSSIKKQLSTGKNQAVHLGMSPDKRLQFTPSARLNSLHEALNEALRKENYEQAAWIRDQIKALKENKNAS